MPNSGTLIENWNHTLARLFGVNEEELPESRIEAFQHAMEEATGHRPCIPSAIWDRADEDGAGSTRGDLSFQEHLEILAPGAFYARFSISVTPQARNRVGPSLASFVESRSSRILIIKGAHHLGCSLPADVTDAVLLGVHRDLGWRPKGNLRSLTAHECTIGKDHLVTVPAAANLVFSESQLGRLPRLNGPLGLLYIFDCTASEDLSISGPNLADVSIWRSGFERICLEQATSLETIHVESCEGLKDIKIGGASPEHFETLAVRDCNKLQKIDLEAGETCLDHWSTFECRDNPLLESVPSFIEARKVEVVNCPKLTSLCLGEPNHLRVEACAHLETIELEGAEELEDLAIRHCRRLEGIEDIVAEAEELLELDLSGCVQVRDEELRVPEGVRKLTLAGCVQIARLENIVSDSLTNLDFSDCAAIVDLRELEQCANLQSLQLSGCTYVDDLGPLSGLTSLRTLQFNRLAYLRNIEPLAQLQELWWLQAAECVELESLAPLAQCAALVALDISGCTTLKSLAPLQECQKLSWLLAREMSAQLDFSPLKTCEALSDLDISGNPHITDVGFLPPGPSELELIAKGCCGLHGKLEHLGDGVTVLATSMDASNASLPKPLRDLLRLELQAVDPDARLHRRLGFLETCLLLHCAWLLAILDRRREVADAPADLLRRSGRPTLGLWGDLVGALGNDSGDETAQKVVVAVRNGLPGVSTRNRFAHHQFGAAEALMRTDAWWSSQLECLNDLWRHHTIAGENGAVVIRSIDGKNEWRVPPLVVAPLERTAGPDFYFYRRARADKDEANYTAHDASGALHDTTRGLNDLLPTLAWIEQRLTQGSQ